MYSRLKIWDSIHINVIEHGVDGHLVIKIEFDKYDYNKSNLQIMISVQIVEPVIFVIYHHCNAEVTQQSSPWLFYPIPLNFSCDEGVRFLLFLC